MRVGSLSIYRIVLRNGPRPLPVPSSTQDYPLTGTQNRVVRREQGYVLHWLSSRAQPEPYRTGTDKLLGFSANRIG